ncbi:unnamed protein product [Moneuplotes crassus]|uniref:RING-type domain-containing protein n=1 Tax=Euplotes crassus TaxID=5936 RepID=A0AAD1Y0C5_EUPCR|nr:unnamed protein product [Moneuplotes crassus]
MECPVCLGNYNEEARRPKILPECGHSLCELCVPQLWKGGSIKCPQDNTVSLVPNIEDLKTNFAALSLIRQNIESNLNGADNSNSQVDEQNNEEEFGFNITEEDKRDYLNFRKFCIGRIKELLEKD